MTQPHLRRSAAVLFLAALAGCVDGEPTTSAERPTKAELATVHCVADVRAERVACDRPTLGANGLIVGGQGVYVFMTGLNASYAGGVFSFDATVQNLIPQPLGTTDGVTPHADGVRVFFSQEPVALAGNGTITIANADGEETFTTAGQPYYEYSVATVGDGILLQNETSPARNWRFNVPATVTSFEFKVLVAAAVQFPDGWIDITPGADTLAEGGTQTLTATVRTVVGNPVPGASVIWETSNAAVATVNAAGTVTAVAPGSATITATSGSRSGSGTFAICPSLSLGEVYVADMPAGASLCLAGAGEYTVVPVNLSDAASVSLSVTGAGIVPVSGPPSPIRLPSSPRLSRAPAAAGRPTRDYAFEDALRLRERREVAGRAVASASRTGARRAITPGVPAVGALMSLNVETDNSCSTFDTRTGRVMAVGTRIIVIADTTNPSGGLSAADYQAVADSFDEKIYSTVTGAFGTPSDIDGNGRVIAFYTRAVNELTPPGSGAYVGGFFFSRDILPVVSCPTSNVGEMFYMLAADPTGDVNGNVRETDFVLDVTLGTLAHEFEHLINASRRIRVNTPWNGALEEVWLDEGMAHIAEELLFYANAGLAPDQNLGTAQIGDGAAVEASFFKYAEANFGRLRQWLVGPHASGPFAADDELATRGAGWAFLRYAADRKSGVENDFWASLIETDLTGLANLESALGTDPLPWLRDFTVAMYADDAGSLNPAAIYRQPSWNFRNLYAALDYVPGPACSCAYELDTRDPSNGVAEVFTLAAGGASAYVRMGVAPSAFAGVTVTSGGGAPPGTVRLAVIRRE